MSREQTFFRLPPKPGAVQPRFCILARDGKTVTRVLASMPDGVEVPAPRSPIFRTDPAPVRTEGYAWL